MIALALLSAACGHAASAGPPPVSAGAVERARARWPDAAAASLEEGRSLFLERCNRCHDYPDIDATPEARWPAILRKMSGNAHLDARQSDSVLRFVIAAHSPSNE